MIDPLSYFSIQPVLNDWCNKNHGMCYPDCGIVHIKDHLLLIENSPLMMAVCFCLNGPLLYVRCHISINKMCFSTLLNKTFFLVGERVLASLVL